MATSLLARLGRLERDAGVDRGHCPKCIEHCLFTRVDPHATPEVVEAAMHCRGCGRRQDFVHLVALTAEEYAAL